jgi:AcrR family transcriptional regulator
LTRPNIIKEREKYLEKHKKDQINKIIQKGRKICFNEGAEKFSVNRVAKETGMTPGNIYTYFRGGKRELWVHMFNNKTDADVIEPFIENFNSGASFLQKIEKTMQLFFDFAENDYNRYKIIWDTPLPEPNIDKETGEPIICEKEKETYPVVLNAFIKTTVEAIQKKEFPDTNPLFFSLFIFSLISGSIKTSNLLKSLKPEGLKPFELKTEKLDQQYFDYTRKNFLDFLKSYLKENQS